MVRGTELYLDIPSHTGTENLIIAATLTAGRTIIENTARHCACRITASHTFV